MVGVRVDLGVVAEERIADQALDALFKLRKGRFDPADVGADAKRKILISKYISVLEENFADPSDEFARALLDLAGVEGRRTLRLIEEQTPIVADALEIFLDRKILERVGFANRHDIVKISAQGVTEEPRATELPADDAKVNATGVITTDTERRVYDYARTRLAFLVDTNALFEGLADLAYQDWKTLFNVYYKQERKGRLFSFREGPSGEMRFEFPGTDGWTEVDDLHAIDDQLLSAFKAAVAAVDD